MIVGLPKHITESPVGLDFFLRTFALGQARFFQAPVYLVGSALIEANPKPRDYDITVELPDEEFERRYGSVKDWVAQGYNGDWTDVRWKWSQDCVKRTKDAWESCHVNVDFKVMPLSHCQKHHAHEKKVLLADYTEPQGNPDAGSSLP